MFYCKTRYWENTNGHVILYSRDTVNRGPVNRRITAIGKLVRKIIMLSNIVFLYFGLPSFKHLSQKLYEVIDFEGDFRGIPI